MRFNPHYDQRDKHAFLSPSKYHWVNYDDEKILETYDKHMDAALGTRLHALAHNLIELKIELPRNSQTLNLYVNDCIGFRMTTEQILFYSPNAFGSADAISFGPNPLDPTGLPLLRVFDLKNGVTPVKVTQLEVYAALFCLEYRVRPGEISYDLRIYQNDDIAEFDTDPMAIAFIMDKIIHFDKLIEKAKEV